MIETQQEPMAQTTALVTAVHRERYAVRHGDGTQGHARIKQAAYRDAPLQHLPTVGDRVTLLHNPAGDSLILGTLPRKSHFLRKLPNVSVGEQAVAANFDEVFILASLNQDFNPRRLERYAAQAWQSGGTPVIILTKADLAGDPAAQVADAYNAAPGVDVHVVSAVTGEGLDAVRTRLLPDRSVVLLGSSGVGKSSLVNALAGQMLMDTGDIREDDARGRHTTTHRQLLTLPNGAIIIDTPGMRELGLWDAEEGLKDAFGDIEALAVGCRFGDCAHKAEPGCAVKRAVEAGQLEAGRLRNYHRLQREAARRERMERIKRK